MNYIITEQGYSASAWLALEPHSNGPMQGLFCALQDIPQPSWPQLTRCQEHPLPTLWKSKTSPDTATGPQLRTTEDKSQVLPEQPLVSGWSHKGRGFMSAGMTWPPLASLTSSPTPALSSSHAAPCCFPMTPVTSLAEGRHTAQHFPLPRTLLPKMSSLITSFSVKALLTHPLNEVHPDHLILKLHASHLHRTVPWSTFLFFRRMYQLLAHRTFSSHAYCLSAGSTPQSSTIAPRAKIFYWLLDMPGTQQALSKSCWMNEWMNGKDLSG